MPLAHFFATKFILSGIGSDAQVGSALFTIIAIIWGYTMAYIGAKGIQYVAKVALYLNVISFLMVLIVFAKTASGTSQHTLTAPADPMAAFTLLIQAVIGFFATAGAAGADFGMNSRNEGDVRSGGFVGIALAILYAGGLPLLSVAGARAMNPNVTSFSYDAVIASVGGLLATSMFLLFAVASIPSACFCALIAGNSFSTMIPGVKAIYSMMVAVTVAIALAATGVGRKPDRLFHDCWRFLRTHLRRDDSRLSFFRAKGGRVLAKGSVLPVMGPGHWDSWSGLCRFSLFLRDKIGGSAGCRV